MGSQKFHRSTLLQRVLMKDTSPNEWFICQCVLEVLALASLSSSVLVSSYLEFQQSLVSTPDKVTESTTLIMFLGLTLQLTTGLSIFRSLYCPLLYATIYYRNYLSCAFLVLFLISLVVEWIRTSDRSFITHSIFAEEDNYLKVLHFLAVGSIVIAYGLLGVNHFWLNCSVLIASFSMVAIRIQARAYSIWYSCLTELVYVHLIQNAVLNLSHIADSLSVFLIVALYTATALLYLCLRIRFRGRKELAKNSLVKSRSVLEMFEQYLRELSQEVVDEK